MLFPENIWILGLYPLSRLLPEGDHLLSLSENYTTLPSLVCPHRSAASASQKGCLFAPHH